MEFIKQRILPTNLAEEGIRRGRREIVVRSRFSTQQEAEAWLTKFQYKANVDYIKGKNTVSR